MFMYCICICTCTCAYNSTFALPYTYTVHNIYFSSYSDLTSPLFSKVERAYMDRVNLSAQGFYRTPDLWFDRSTGKGNLYSYFSYGASVSEVEVDTLTGDFTILRSDLVMDVGDSLNPAIDIGQVTDWLDHTCTCTYIYVHEDVNC